MTAKALVSAERDVVAANDALAAALAHGDAEEKRRAREVWRTAQRKLARLSAAGAVRRA